MLPRLCLVLALSTACAGLAAAQTTGSAPLQGIGLNAEHKRMIYEGIAADTLSPAGAPDVAAIGREVPDSIMLREMPIELKDKIGVLRDFKFAKLSNDSIVIVDPAQRRVVDVVTKQDAGR